MRSAGQKASFLRRCTRVFRAFTLLLGFGCGLAAGGTAAWACACCTNQGQRTVGVVKLDSTLREEIGRLRFMAQAELYTGERDTSDIKGIANPSSTYEMHVAQEPDRWVFAFNDKDGRKGTLTLALPATVAIFSVDPRLDEREGGTGPSLFKEWKLTSSASGNGIFTPGMGSGQRITLIVQAHGNNCTSPDMATHWTLMVHGPKADYHFFGKIVQ
jgi:hypothetical protein